MNENSKLQNMRNFKSSLHAAAGDIGAKVIPTPREGPTAFRVEAMDNENLYVELTFVQYHDGDQPRIAFGSESANLTNLSVANIKKHLIKRLAKRRADLAEMALDDAKDDASAKAEKSMVKTITSFLPGTMKRGVSDIDSPMWKNERGWFKLAYIHVTGTVNAFEFEYNIEYDFKAGVGREIHIRGEFDAKTSDQIRSTMSAILAIN